MFIILVSKGSQKNTKDFPIPDIVLPKTMDPKIISDCLPDNFNVI